MESRSPRDLLERKVRDPIRRNHSDIYRCRGAKYTPTPEAVALRREKNADDDIGTGGINVLKARKIQLPSILAPYDNIFEIPERFQAEQVEVLEDVDFDVRMMQSYISNQQRQFEILRRREECPK